MSMIKKVGLTGVVLAIVFVVAFICFNRKEKKIDRKQDLPVSTETISEYSLQIRTICIQWIVNII